MTDKQKDLSALNNISNEMRKRLLAMIKRRDPHFILTGSDPSECGGCCPSNEVGHASRLVFAGILEFWQPCCGEDACPSRFYSFSGERLPNTSPPEFKPNEDLRAVVAARLSPSGTSVDWKKIGLKYFLFTFVAMCLTIFASRELRGNHDRDLSADAAIAVACKNMSNGYLVCVIKTARACSACVAMESYTQQALAAHYQTDGDAGRVRLLSFSAAGEINLKFRERERIMATSLVLMEIRNSAIHRSRIITEAWLLLNNEEDFVLMVKDQLDAFMKETS